MNAIRITLAMWVALGLLVSNGQAAADRTPPPPGPDSHRAPPAHPPKHKAPPAPKSKPKPPAPKPPGTPKPPGGIGKPWWGQNPAPPHPPGHPGKPWSGNHPDPDLHNPHDPDPHDPDPHHPDPHHPDPHHPDPDHPDPDLHEPWNRPPEPPPHHDPHGQGYHPPELLNESDRPVRCRINGGLVLMSPGRVLPLEPDRPSMVEFHRGGEFGIARYELAHGVHKFVRTEHGWELVRAEHEPPRFPPHYGLPENP